MPIRREKNWKAVTAQLQTIVREGVAASGVVWQQELKSLLNRPGRGRIYLRNQSGAKFVHDGMTIGKVSFVTRAGVGVGEISARTAAAERYAERMSRNAARSGGPSHRRRTRRDQGFHRASAPGHPPAPDTARLRNSMAVDVSRLREPQSTVRIGTAAKSKVPYAVWMEYGTRHIAPRPYFRPSTPKVAPKIKSIFRTMLSRLGRVR